MEDVAAAQYACLSKDCTVALNKHQYAVSSLHHNKEVQRFSNTNSRNEQVKASAQTQYFDWNIPASNLIYNPEKRVLWYSTRPRNM